MLATRLFACGAAIAVAMAVGPVAARAQVAGPVAADAQLVPSADDVVGLVVTRDRETSAAEAESLVADAVDEPTSRAPIAPGVTAVAVPDLSLREAKKAARDLEKEPGIAEVGLDTHVHADALNDPLFSDQWPLTDVVSGVSALPAWDLTTGDGQVIAIIDTGVTAHQDLAANLVGGYDMIEDPVVANDSDGRDPDPSDPGDWCGSEPSSWHGTHVAGLAAAVQGNGKGISGLAPRAKIEPVRALGTCGGKMSDVAAAITWASGGDVPGVPANPTPASVINMSLSSTTTCQPYLQAAIDTAIARGSTIVASAGNNNTRFDVASPGGCYDVIPVGAVDRAGNRAGYSNYGTAGRDLPVFAPGGAATADPQSDTGLLSTIDKGAMGPAGDAYGSYVGTSMAAPLVSGAAALLRSRTSMSPAAVAEHLRDTARPFPPGSNCSGSCGAGLLDVNAALRTSPRVPGRPAAVMATPADATVVARWELPDDPGTGPITGYTVEYRSVPGQWVALQDLWSSTLREKVINGLANGVGYQVRVAAHNVFGLGPWIESDVVIPESLPGAVRINSVRYPSKTKARLRLVVPAQSLLGLQYRVTKVGREPGEWQSAAVSGSLTLRGLVRGVRHSVEVRVFNELGAGPTTARQIATPVKPSAVRALKVKRKGSRLAVRWQEPKRTGLRLSYRVRVAEARKWSKTAGLKAVVRGPRKGPVRVEVQPRNKTGRGPIRSIRKRK